MILQAERHIEANRTAAFEDQEFLDPSPINDGSFYVFRTSGRCMHKGRSSNAEDSL